MRVLVFAPHQDDETVGLGGTIYKHVQHGDKVKIVFVTDGSGGGMDIDPRELIKIREKEATEACKVLGVKELEFLRFKDGFLTYDERVLLEIGKIIRNYKPHRIYVPSGEAPPYMDNLDHINTFKIVTQAAFKVQYRNYPQFGTDVWKTDEIYSYELIYPLTNPTTYVDITDVIDVKREALKCYRSQLREQPYWIEYALQLNRMRGILTGLGEYVEAFKAIRSRLTFGEKGNVDY